MTNGDLLTKTSTAGGSSFGGNVTVDSTDDVGQYASITAADFENVFVSYFNLTELELTFASSHDSASTWGTPEIIDTDGAKGSYSSLASAGTRYHFVAYYDINEQNLLFSRADLLVDFNGHRIMLFYSLNPSDGDSAVLSDGRILRLAQMTVDTWLFQVPAGATSGPDIEQTQIRIVIKPPDGLMPGFYTIGARLVPHQG